ncbi:MAG: phosphoglycerate kinase [Verrucomicrobia bacterium]|nr:phosphoglycerate kinase [Verrucomicrobiota bacterium]
MEKLTLRDLPIKGKRVLMRVDFNVPLDANGQISDDSRIAASLPSIKYVLDRGGSLVLMSHLGRPDGKPNRKYSLAPCAKRLSEKLNRPVILAHDCIGQETEKKAQNLKPGEILLLENLRFHEGEEHTEKDPDFVSQLAKLGDLYVNDAFGTAHRAHASTSFIAQFFPHRAAAGFLMEREILALGSLLQNPKRPFYAVIGGSKVSTKAGVIKNLIPRIDGLFIGGGMAYTFLKAKSFSIGKSLYDEAEGSAANEIIEAAKKKGIPCHLPLDLIVASDFRNDAESRIVSIEEGVPEGWQGMGIGPKTTDIWSTELQKASTIFWNGPLSVFEMPSFAKGTFAIAEALARSKATVVVGGGDSVAAIQMMGLGGKFAHLSTGGGASLEFLEFGHLPGIDALSDKK